MKKITIEQIRELAACGVNHVTIRPETDQEAFETAAHLVEIGAQWWSPVEEVHAEMGDGKVRHWHQGNGTFVIEREGGNVRLDVTVATFGVVVAKAA